MHNRAERGASSVEYGLLVSLIAGAIIGMIFTLGQSDATSMNDSCDRIVSTINNGTC